ncbi:amidohydrolase [Nocardioides terrisoli]|uniref:amidohydrolase n=1 Tax=Nocardioides terrisoli TaxID=3388267 RepID=UPI00287BAA67|nr:amidohydrolase family protein [Nocardioides marmorisolisilvae]
MTSHRIVFRNGVVHTGDAVEASFVAVQDGIIVHVGADTAAYDDADELVDLRGALLAPAFVDAHVHSVLTGFGLTRLDLRATRSLAEALDAVATLARMQPTGVLVGTGWEEHAWPEGRPPTAAELDRAAPGRLVLLERRDCHSCIVSPSLLDVVPVLAGTDGFDASGRLERDARQAASEALGTLVGPEQRLVAARAAVQAMAAAGIAGFHEAAAPHIGPAYELDLVRHAAELTGLLPTFYWGQRDAFDRLAELGAAGLAGDLNVDGAIGSRTAALHHGYDDDPDNHGHTFLSPEEIAEHLEACTRAGVQGGFHCIGEAGLDAVVVGLTLLVERVGADAVRAARHRLEHVEMPSPELIARLAELGIVASMQPAFDALWGGPDQMYATRLGERWHDMNPLGSMHRAGVAMAFGSDTPVTPIDPWGAVRSAIEHRDVTQRITPTAAFEAHTAGGWHAARQDGVGRVRTGAPAHLAVWDCAGGLEGTLPLLAEDVPAPALRTLYVHGRAVGREA